MNGFLVDTSTVRIAGFFTWYCEICHTWLYNKYYISINYLIPLTLFF